MELPDEYELLWLFEQEPSLLDAGQSWVYNHLTFTIDRNDERVVCMISPADRDVQIFLERGGRVVVDLSVSFVSRLSVRKERETEALVLDFSIEEMRQLWLYTKPHFYIRWGTDLQYGIGQ